MMMMQLGMGERPVTVVAPLVYAVGLDPLMLRALRADLARAEIHRLRRLTAPGGQGRCGRRPDLVLLDLSRPDVEAERSATRATWGDSVPVVGLSRWSPFAHLWQRQELAELVEIGPGFLSSLLG